MKTFLRAVILIGLTVPAFGLACESESEMAGQDGDDIDGGSGGAAAGTGGATIDGTGGGTSDAPCASAEDCVDGEVCHPAALVCVTPGATCESHADCGTGESCDAGSSMCLPGLTGSACDTSDNCVGGAPCEESLCGCSGFSQEQEEEAGPLDIFFVLDRTASMGSDCAYTHGGTPSVDSKACYATYAVSDYLIDVQPISDTRLAFDFMSYPDGCDGYVYEEPLIGLMSLPVDEDSEIIMEIDDEDFGGGSGTRIEDALKGIALFTDANRTEGREMIGVLMTDGDPSEDCNADIGQLAQIISDHREATGIRTFIIGMDGATESNLEQLAIAGGAEAHDDFCGTLTPPCHYWNVGTGSGDAIADALRAIAEQAVPLPCEYDLADVQPANGETLDLATINVRLTDTSAMSTIMPRVDGEGDCPAGEPAWYYDSLANPKTITLCKNACDLVADAEAGAKVSIVGGCSATVIFK